MPKPLLVQVQYALHGAVFADDELTPKNSRAAAIDAAQGDKLFPRAYLWDVDDLHATPPSMGNCGDGFHAMKPTTLPHPPPPRTFDYLAMAGPRRAVAPEYGILAKCL